MRSAYVRLEFQYTALPRLIDCCCSCFLFHRVGEAERNAEKCIINKSGIDELYEHNT